MTDDVSVSSGTLLAGRVSYRQLSTGYRTGLEPVLLAASVPAQPGDRVIEAGTGAGAGLLCLASRVRHVSGLGIESDPALAALAHTNLAANGHTALSILCQDVTAWQADATYDHAFANPPWHSDAGTVSPEPGRRRAKTAESDLLTRWATPLARALRRRGTLTFILPAALLAHGIHALIEAECAETTVLPFWPRLGEEARLIVLCGIRHGRGPARLLPGIVLHKSDGTYTMEAEQVLRSGGGVDGD